MPWHMTGQLIEACSCRAACPCLLGPAEPDQGWCSGALTFVIQQGEADGVNLGGRTVVWLIDLPKDFASGNGTVRLYIDDAADARQRQELEAIFTGKKGGPGAVLGSLVTKWLPTQTTTITIDGGENLGSGHLRIRPPPQGLVRTRAWPRDEPLPDRGLPTVGQARCSNHSPDR
jgi:hypothetical protein